MSKDSGMGDLLYLDGRNLSGDIGAINEISGGPAVVDSTHITKDALERIGTTLAGQLIFDAYFNPAGAHPPLSALPVADVVSTYLRGPAADTACAGLIGRQVDYPGSRGIDGSLHFTITVLSDGAGVEWGRGYVGGPTRVDSGATTGAGINDGASSSAGMAAYLHVLAFTGTSVTVTIEHSDDNGVGDAYTTALTFTVVTAAPNGQRVATAATATIKRWLRVKTAGTFSALTMHVMAYRGITLGVIVAVDVQIFTSSGTWTKPIGVTATFVALVGGGGGGGSGACVNVLQAGGAGGGGGGFSRQIFPSSALAATETVTIGAGGNGGAAKTSGGGIVGSQGGNTSFGTTQKMLAVGGGGGASGSAASNAGGTGGNAEEIGTAGGGGNAGAAGTLGTTALQFAGAGGGAGGGADTVPTAFTGGQGGSTLQTNFTGFGAAGAINTNGGNATGVAPNAPSGGQGGGGGGSSVVGNAGSGGAGGIYGGGGGGGGGCRTGSTSGAGGAGAAGICVVVSW